MRPWLILVVLAGCWSADPKPVAQPAAVITAPRAVAPTELDWPTLIGKPEADARRAITRFLAIDEAADLVALGIEIHARDQRAETIFLHIQPESAGGPTYVGRLFRGVRPTMTQEQILEILGPPDEQGTDPVWIKYRRPEAQLHFQFTGDKLYMVTLMRADWSPGS